MLPQFGRESSRIAAWAGLGLTLTLLAMPPPAMAQSNAEAAPRTLSVSGEGEVKAVPDEALLSAGVVSQSRTAAEALAVNRRAMNAVFAALKAQGIPDKSIQTSDFTVSPQYDSGRNGSGPQRLVGYQVSNTVSVSVDDLAKLGATIDALVASGSNSLGGVSFAIRDPKPLLAQARAAAVKDALDRAETYAGAAGVTLGRAITISESENDVSMPRPMFRAMAVMNGAPASPTAAGEESVSAGVSMTFEIK
jgi:uncharacterized protein YggE